MTDIRTLESIVDPFVNRVGGKRISEMVDKTNTQKNADYLFDRHQVIAELKSLQAGSLIEAFQRKLTNLTKRWQKEGKLVVFGTAMVSSSRLSPECREEMFSAMAESLQKNVVATANAQIRSTKDLLNLPNAKGLLWVASDGNEFLQPNTVWYLLHRILQKKKSDGSPAYSNIHGLAYFSPRMLARVPGIPEPVILWMSGYRQRDPHLEACLQELSDEWPKYVSWAQGVPIRLATANANLDDTRFLGVDEKLLQIDLSNQ